ncbi:MAG: hypothetical protein A3I26_00670 [Candidatus Yanofskybacteria bacterium RIFCSPLOWO2_02_FULL_43_10]|uniref:Uncharacterized protein n=1 Tax=Candidatus Yanofskybacteria bacterium RIFCSPLOWO2_12_FULL_43_11b TaxID=1802710 RepID=A0A1F8H737_9BACT|nr:MAG: hypothetical protein A2742_03885 [Candidatus Yanofskybacteria bacterium RIFCSPHIGHO2_01_FULL_43_32]OGN10939.1 MAG: hypothetical protein A3C69_03095 [Candidatus Yanofskybacteria bacterium RIFCSPHIGHO2_02_FULL_43_12]OGN17088.1 MAG: hypothetical protein A3E34_03400 [Candidatus Yanofskybacteria bacterium RIFCSPHIGHO2_12_FULL_43_11]OGN24422.1 MAG: hypothetical protein A2923_00870 [Candidatus Yanofskybacteria bacterium RIFCSPLOWO2_01_FULL_43_46]OGN28487.1 MAG: hypothetical protein A3I26_00670
MINPNENFNRKLLRKSIFWSVWLVVVIFTMSHIVDILMIIAVIINGEMSLWEIVKELIKSLFSR